MTQLPQGTASLSRVPSWVPLFALRYLAHTEKGISIRELARKGDVHASTVLRQIRRVETKRDDPLIDEALEQLGELMSLPKSAQPGGADQKEALTMTKQPETVDFTEALDDADLTNITKGILLKLNDAGAVLAFAKDMEKAVVVRNMPDGSTLKTAVVDRQVAQAMALKDWISCANPGKISRYRITPSGRAKLARLEGAQSGFHETHAAFEPHASALDQPNRRMRFSSQESPVAVLARRKDKEGHPFLARDLVQASERLREDFELSQIGAAVTQNWGNSPSARTVGPLGGGSATCAGQDAQVRLSDALEMLGEGLADVALRCCCHQEGMESIEKRLGWPARSGKVVLRIALIKLREHYINQPSDEHDLIG